MEPEIARNNETGNEFQPVSLKLQADLDISSVDALHKALGDLVNSGRPVSIDAGCVERIDTAALQLLCAFRQTAEQACVEVRWSDVSPIVDNAASMLDLKRVLDLPASD